MLQHVNESEISLRLILKNRQFTNQRKRLLIIQKTIILINIWMQFLGTFALGAISDESVLFLYEPWLYGKQFCPSNVFLEAVSGSSCFYILYFYVLNVKRFQTAYRRTSLSQLRLISRGNLLFFVLVNIIIYQLLNWPPRLVVSCQNLEGRNTWCEDKRWCRS